MDLSHMVFDNSHIRHTETVHSFILHFIVSWRNQLKNFMKNPPPPPTNRDRVKQRLSL